LKSTRMLVRKSTHVEEESEGTWALSYGDMITLLLSFFVIFFTTDPQKEKEEKVSRHLRFTLEGVTPAESFDPKVTPGKPLKFDYKIKTTKVGDSIVVTFGSFSFFKSGELTLVQEAQELLSQFASKYQPFAGSYRIAIKGFTDRRQVNKNLRRSRQFVDNLELSALRSVAVMRVLKKKGIPLHRMEIAGAGELKAINQVLPRVEGLTDKEINDYSRTVVMVITPIGENWL
jgi:flagellar motor protein MotB